MIGIYVVEEGRNMKNIENEILSILDGGKATVFQILSRLNVDIDTVSKELFNLKQKKLITVSNGVISPGPALQIETRKTPAAGSDQELLDKFRELTVKRPEPLFDYDQGHVTPESVHKRVQLLDQRGDLEDSSVLLLGDDDLTSLFLLLTGKPRRITVLDIDERLLTFIEDARARLQAEMGFHDLHFETVVYNVRDDLPEHLKEQYTLVITDPLETEKGFRLFMRRAVQALKGPDTTLLMCLTDLESPPRKWWEFQRLLLNAGLVIKDIISNCQRYTLPQDSFVFQEYPLLEEFKCPEKPEENWYHSSLLRLVAVTKPDPTAIPIDTLGDIYLEPEKP